MPTRATTGSAGYDVYANADVVLPANGQVAVPTGIFFTTIPDNHFVAIRSRSGLAFKHGVTAFHGTVDNDYRGEVKVLLFNHSDKEYSVKKGDRVAQFIIMPYGTPDIEWATEQQVSESTTERGSGGFGSTGSK